MFPSQNKLGALVNKAAIIFGQPFPVYRNVPLPRPLVNPVEDGKGFFEVPALFTTDGLRPRWGNLGVAIGNIGLSSSQHASVFWWKEVVSDLRLSLAVLVSRDIYILIERTNDESMSMREVENESDLEAVMLRCRDSIFSPRSLGFFRTGQLSLADLEDSFADHSFASHFRHKAQISDALKNALKDQGHRILSLMGIKDSSE